MTDKYNEHYAKVKLQPWNFIAKFNLDFFQGNVVKYLARFEQKGTPVQDLNKAINYLEKAKKFKYSTQDEKYILKFLNQYQGYTRLLLWHYFTQTKPKVINEIKGVIYNYEHC